MTIDAGALSLIHSAFIDHLTAAFTTIANYAFNLLYIFATFEIVIFGLLWAIKRELGLDKLFFKVIKIGLIFFIIQNYTWLVDIILKSFAQIAGVVLQNSSAAAIIFNPATIWQFGYNAGLTLLQIAAEGSNLSLSIIQIVLGMGILFTFGLLGIQIILQIVGFYLVAMTGLILVPFGALEKTAGMFDKSVKVVLQAGIRVMTLIIVMGIGSLIWGGLDLNGLGDATAKTITIGPPLGLFFTALLFLYLAIHLPKMAAETVGKIGGFAGTEGAAITVSAPTTEATAGTVTSDMVNMTAATTLPAASESILGESAATSSAIGAGTQIAMAGSSGGTAAGNINGKISETAKALEIIAKSSTSKRSISEQGLKQLKEILDSSDT